MKFIANRSALLEAVRLCCAVVPARCPKPVCCCIKIEARATSVHLDATNLERYLQLAVTQVQVESIGSALVAAKTLQDVLREMSDDTVSIGMEKEQIVVRGNDSFFKLEVMPVSDYPPAPAIEEEKGVTMLAGDLKLLIERTIGSVAKESTRYAFNGVLIKTTKKQITMAGTDGRRLAVADADGKLERDLDDPVVPAGACQVVSKMIDDPEATVTIVRDGGRIRFQIGDATLTSALVEGQFPPYADIIPKNPTAFLTAGKTALISAVRRAALLTSEESKGVTWSLNAGKGVQMNSRTMTAGEASVNLATKVTGTEMKIGFNPYFLLDGINGVAGDEVEMEFESPSRPGLIKGSRFFYVCMPVSLNT